MNSGRSNFLSATNLDSGTQSIESESGGTGSSIEGGAATGTLAGSTRPEAKLGPPEEQEFESAKMR